VQLRRGIANPADEFRGIFSVETVDRYVRESLDQLQGCG